MKFDVLHNFISPVTGRVLSDYNYVLVGNKQGIAIPSPILIDIRLDLINLRRDFNHLADASFIVGFANDQIPNAQVLKSLSNGFMFNTKGIVSTTGSIPIGALPNLTLNKFWIGDNNNRPVEILVLPLLNLTNLTSKYIWRGDINNRPIEVNDLTVAEGQIGGLLSDLANLASIVNTLSNTVDALSSAVNAIETGIGVLGGLLGLLALQTQVAGLFVTVSNLGNRISALHLDGFVVSTTPDSNGIMTTSRGPTCLLTNIPAGDNVSIDNFKIINLADPTNPTDGVNLRTLQNTIGTTNLTLQGDVTGNGNIDSPIQTTLELTLDQIRVAQNTVNLNNQRIKNLQQSPVETHDAISAQFLWDLMHDEVGVIWQ